MSDRDVLSIVEIPYETGERQLRYSRYMSNDGTRWIRHGLFEAYYKNGQLSSEGTYEDGMEVGMWRDYHDNGRLAAEGEYKEGRENGRWRYWRSDGTLEKEVVYFNGNPVSQSS